MPITELQQIVQEIVREATELKNKYTDAINARVNYACIFSYSEQEFKSLVNLAKENGKIVKETSAGPIFRIPTLSTVSGSLKLLKIRKPDKSKHQKGYADFTIKDFSKFKKKYLQNKNFHLFTRPGYEIIGIKNSNANVSTYFANPPLDEQLKQFL